MKKQKKLIKQPPGAIKCSDLDKIVALILKKIVVEKIICVASVVNQISVTNCFPGSAGHFDEHNQNSYYLLVVPATEEKLADILIQQRLEEEVKHLAKVAVIVYRMHDINEALKHSSSFFTSIYTNGALLYDRGAEVFSFPAQDPAGISKRIIQREQFWQKWFQLSGDFLTGARFYASNKKNGLALFMAHQSLQHCYSGVLRVYTGFRSNTNGLPRLMKLIEIVVPDFAFSSAKPSPEWARLKGLLLKGFGDARYHDKFDASDEETGNIIDRIADILNMANSGCIGRINDIKEGKIPYNLKVS